VNWLGLAAIYAAGFLISAVFFSIEDQRRRIAGKPPGLFGSVVFAALASVPWFATLPLALLRKSPPTPDYWDPED